MSNLAHAMWVHGHSMQIQDPNALQSVERLGQYIRIEGKRFSSTFLHFAIPTPVIVDDHRLRVGSVLLVFRTMSAEATVTDLWVNDGEVNIAYHNDKLYGNVGLRRFDVPNHPYVNMGIGITVAVHFSGIESLPLTMEFISAGCDFLP